VNYALQQVLNEGSGSLIEPRISTRTNFPIAAKTGTSNNNGSTWVVGHTMGLATAAWFGDALGSQGRAGQNITVNGKFYTGIDGYMIAGPMFSNFMSQIAPGYGTEPFPEPPSNLLYGTPDYQPTVPDNPTQSGNTGANTGTSTGGNTGATTGGNTGGSTGGTGNNGNGNGNSKKGNG
jgi:membrane peptidoglycan carboxypeptidase